jgi:hypothetical protein
MKEITVCIGDIGRANSTIFSTLDLTSLFWQIKLDENSQHLTAFTIPGQGQICLGHFSNGTFRLSSQFSNVDGGCTAQPKERFSLHR